MIFWVLVIVMQVGTGKGGWAPSAESAQRYPTMSWGGKRGVLVGKSS